jgi:hypothetical protein
MIAITKPVRTDFANLVVLPEQIALGIRAAGWFDALRILS